MKLYRKISFFLFLSFFIAIQAVYPNIDSLKQQFSVQKGETQLETGLKICEELAEEPSQLIDFSLTLLQQAEHSFPHSLIVARIAKAVCDGYYYSDSLKKSTEYLLKAIDIAESIEPIDTQFLGEAYNDLGLNYQEMGNLIEARNYLNRAILLLEKTQFLNELADAKSNMAGLNHAEGKYQEAINLFKEVHQLDLKTKNINRQSISLNSLGRMYVDWGKYETGLDYYFRSIQLLDSITDKAILGVRYNNIGMVYQLMGKHREAIIWLEKARKIDEQEKNSIKLGIRHFNIGNSYLSLRDYQKARINIEKSLAIFKNSNLFSMTSKVYGSLGSLYQQEGDFSKAEEYLILSLNMAEKGENIPEKSIIYSKLYQFYKQTGNYRKALDYYEQHTVAKDSIYNLQASKQIEELEAQYQNEKKGAEITRLEKENELKIKELSFRKRERNWAIAGALLFLIAAGSFFLLFSTVKKQKAKLSEQNIELDRLNKTLNRLFAIISHDLRNATAAYQSSAKIIDYHLGKGQPEKLLPLSGEISNNANNLSVMLENLLQWSVLQMKGIEPRKQLFALKPEIEKVVGLLKNEANKKGNSIELNILEEKAFCDPESFNLIIRNLLGNSNKFTENGLIQVSTTEKDGITTLFIKDTGCGMTPSMVADLFKMSDSKIRQGTAGEKGTGLGLMMVAEHIEKNRGSISVESEEGKGTTFIVSLPR
jgi:signal transduction histidine kinase/uncharacterized protein HemY